MLLSSSASAFGIPLPATAAVASAAVGLSLRHRACCCLPVCPGVGGLRDTLCVCMCPVDNDDSEKKTTML